MKRLILLAALGIAGCGGSELQNTSAAVRAPDCPKSIAPGPRAAAQASRALFAALPKLYPTLDRKRATVQGLFSLAGGLPSTIKTKRYTSGAASKACGEEVINASWVAFVLLPNSPPDASEHVVFLVLTAKGWRVWFESSKQNPDGAGGRRLDGTCDALRLAELVERERGERAVDAQLERAEAVRVVDRRAPGRRRRCSPGFPAPRRGLLTRRSRCRRHARRRSATAHGPRCA